MITTSKGWELERQRRAALVRIMIKKNKIEYREEWWTVDYSQYIDTKSPIDDP